MKDEALTPVAFKMEHLPVARVAGDCGPAVADIINARIGIARSNVAVWDWLRHEFGIDKPGRALADPHKLNPDAFVTAVRAALPRAANFPPPRSPG